MATKVEKITHVCSRTGLSKTGTPDEVAEFFYRDKSTASGFSPWCKDAEREYNRAYRAANTAAGVARKKDADEKGAKKFDATMTKMGVRTQRKSRATSNENAPAKPARKPRAKVATKSA